MVCLSTDFQNDALGPEAPQNVSAFPFSLVCGLATPRQYRCNGNCEIFVAAETFGLTIDVIRNGGKR
jgi:hypothetical protein